MNYAERAAEITPYCLLPASILIQHAICQPGFDSQIKNSVEDWLNNPFNWKG